MRVLQKEDIMEFSVTYTYQDGDHTHDDTVEEKFVSVSVLREVLLGIMTQNTDGIFILPKDQWIIKKAFAGVLDGRL